MPNIIEGADAAGSTSTAYTLTPGQTLQGQLGVVGDQDYYRVNLVAGHTYVFAMVGTGVNKARDTYLQLFNADGSVAVAFDDNGLPNLNSVIKYTPTTSGVYYIDASAWTSTGQYGLSFTEGTRASFDVQMGAGV